MSATSMLTEARKWLGISGRPNTLTRAYASRHGAEFLRAPWCDIGVTECARRSGNAKEVLPAGDRAYTLWHAQDFQRAGRWKTGTVAEVNAARPADIVFFDWGASDSIGAIDHVGVVEKVLGGGRVQTIEFNTADSVRRRVRAASLIAGYGRPAYATAPKPKPPQAPPFRRTLRQPPLMQGEDVRTWQRRMKDRGWRIKVDGWYGPDSERACRAFQADKRLRVSGDVDKPTWRATWEKPVT